MRHRATLPWYLNATTHMVARRGVILPVHMASRRRADLLWHNGWTIRATAAAISAVLFGVMCVVCGVAGLVAGLLSRGFRATLPLGGPSVGVWVWAVWMTAGSWCADAAAAAAAAGCDAGTVAVALFCDFGQTGCSAPYCTPRVTPPVYWLVLCVVQVRRRQRRRRRRQLLLFTDVFFSLMSRPSELHLPKSAGDEKQRGRHCVRSTEKRRWKASWRWKEVASCRA